MTPEQIEKEIDKQVDYKMKEFKKQLNGLIKDNQMMAMALLSYYKEIADCVHCGNPVEKLKAKKTAEEY